jgi:hypothetical protein
MTDISREACIDVMESTCDDHSLVNCTYVGQRGARMTDVDHRPFSSTAHCPTRQRGSVGAGSCPTPSARTDRSVRRSSRDPSATSARRLTVNRRYSAGAIPRRGSASSLIAQPLTERMLAGSQDVRA